MPVIIRSNDVVTIAGQRGTGKSTLGRQVARIFKKIIIYDPLCEHGMLGTVTHNLDDG